MDPGYPLPSPGHSLPSGTAPPCQGGTAPGGTSHPSHAAPGRQQPWPHSHGQANIAAAVFGSGLPACAPDSTAATEDGNCYCNEYGDYFYEEEQQQPAPPPPQPFQQPPQSPAPYQQQMATYTHESNNRHRRRSHTNSRWRHETTSNRRRHRRSGGISVIPVMSRPLPLRLLPEHLHLPRALCIY